jgi:hypothetical protein
MANEIIAYFHCKQCIAELPADTSPRAFAQLEVGWTGAGLQVWCKRHETNVVNLDFLGQKVATKTG